MNILLIGSGGREHAIGWKIAQSPRLTKLYIAPGNPGTAELGENLPINVADHAAVIHSCEEKKIDLVVVGPEIPLAAGLADDLSSAGFKVFGPCRAAAQIEASKVFSKNFMQRHGIPTARFATFRRLDEACAHIDQVDYPVVLKASGLAAGKGVVLPETRAEARTALEAILVKSAFGAAGDEVVIEERLQGPEVTLLAFSDGVTVKPMLPSQDHKRALDGDRGLNTGGMGAYAPVPACPPEMISSLVALALQPAVDGLRAEETPFAGVLYGGFMLTPDGPRVIEFNCRFGDPEAQVVLPLLASDLLEIALACAEGRLDQVEVNWKTGAAACVVLASAGYPEKYLTGYPIHGLEFAHPNSVVFHAGTKTVDGKVVTAGGRVLSVTGWGEDISAALASAYSHAERIGFEGMHYRKDIGWRVIQRTLIPSDYAASGVDIDAGNRAVDLMKASVKATYGPEVLAGIGSFGGLFDASALKDMRHPVLVASTDGVGTKVKLAAQAGRYSSIGRDIVNHCIDDILVQGARPLFFLDYFATSRLKPEIVAEVVSGISDACREAGCALIGGETAEMPGVYTDGEFDLAGTIIGVLERDSILPRPDIRPGDVLLGVRSSGPHTNGFSLIRKIFKDVPLETVFPELGTTLAEALLQPHRSYYPLLYPVLDQLKGLAHITGGGFIENIPRVLPEGTGVEIRKDSWPLPLLFDLIQQQGEVAPEEMYRVFNMGIGMVLIVGKENVSRVQEAVLEPTYILGEVIAGAKKVNLI